MSCEFISLEFIGSASVRLKYLMACCLWEFCHFNQCLLSVYISGGREDNFQIVSSLILSRVLLAQTGQTIN